MHALSCWPSLKSLGEVQGCVKEGLRQGRTVGEEGGNK